MQLTQNMTITDISRHHDKSYDVKGEVDPSSLYNRNAIRFEVAGEYVRLFPIGETVLVTIVVDSK